MAAATAHGRRAAHYEIQIGSNLVDRLVCANLKLANAFCKYLVASKASSGMTRGHGTAHSGLPGQW